MTGTQLWWVSVAVAWALIVWRANGLVGHYSKPAPVFFACCLCWFGPLAIVAAVLLRPCDAERARRRAQVAIAEAELAEARARIRWAEWDEERVRQMLVGRD